jgi:hypothetical protein
MTTIFDNCTSSMVGYFFFDAAMIMLTMTTTRTNRWRAIVTTNLSMTRTILLMNPTISIINPRVGPVWGIVISAVKDFFD